MRWRPVAATVAVLLAGTGAGWAVNRVAAGSAAPVPSGPAAVPAATVAVERTDLSTARTVPGTLGYGAARAVKGTTGTVTWLPTVGAPVARGRALYRNDDRPVPVFYGTTPLFREITGVGLAGRDVRVVIDNLRALGHRVGDQPYRTVRPGDGVLTPDVVAAVKSWQLTAGLPVTGRIRPADVVVLPGAARVSRIVAQLGDPAGQPLLEVTGGAKVVTVPVAVAEKDTVRPGDRVRVELPGGRTTPGRVAGLDRDARAPDGAGDGDGAAAQVDVTVTLGDAKAAGGLESGPVRVSFPGEVRKGVLAVPVAALLALREGGYAVQVAGGPLVAVRTGMFAMGLVEISGTGITEGTVVVTAS